MPSTKQVHSAASTRSSPKQDIRQNVRGAISRPKALNNLDAKDNQDVKTNDSSHLTEVDREWFNIKIRDLEDKLARALDERHKFEEETIVAKECFAKLKSDNEDIISFLKNSLQTRFEVCKEMSERMKGLQLARETETNYFKNELESSKRHFDNLEQKMSSEIKLLQGKLTSLEEFRLKKDQSEELIRSLESKLKEKEHDLSQQMEKYERQTLIRIEEIKKLHQTEINEMKAEMEKTAIAHLNESSRRALEENTLLLRNVRRKCSNWYHKKIQNIELKFYNDLCQVIGGRLTLIESKLSTKNYQNMGLKELLVNLEKKYSDVSKQLIHEKHKNQAIEDIAKILQQKEAEFCEIEKIESGLRAENAILKKQLEQANAERMKNMAKMSELINLSEKTRDMYSKSKKKSDNLLSAISRAKQLMTVITTGEKEDSDFVMKQITEFINENYSL